MPVSAPPQQQGALQFFLFYFWKGTFFGGEGLVFCLFVCFCCFFLCDEKCNCINVVVNFLRSSIFSGCCSECFFFFNFLLLFFKFSFFNVLTGTF